MVLVFTATLFFYWQRQKEQKGEGERGGEWQSRRGERNLAVSAYLQNRQTEGQ